MDIQAFRYKMTDYEFAELNDRYLLFKEKGKWLLYDAELESEQEVSLDDELVKSLIEQLDDVAIELMGGRGASGGKKTKVKFKRENSNTSMDLTVKMNSKIKTKTVNEAIGVFRKTHGNDKKESAIVVDAQGFVYQYNHGGKRGVKIYPTGKGHTVIHNHPNGGWMNFSHQDLKFVAQSKANSIVATHSKGYRKFTKGTHFKAKEFAKAVREIEKNGLKGKNFDKAMDGWLRYNQKRYGYKFESVRD